MSPCIAAFVNFSERRTELKQLQLHDNHFWKSKPLFYNRDARKTHMNNSLLPLASGRYLVASLKRTLINVSLCLFDWVPFFRFQVLNSVVYEFLKEFNTIYESLIWIFTLLYFLVFLFVVIIIIISIWFIFLFVSIIIIIILVAIIIAITELLVFNIIII